jgi:eukaryotic-like serine/threonine-protein kinase
MLTKSRAKLMDFGLAKATTTGFGAGASGGTTIAVDPLTEEGMIVGTFQYMAPEQLEGKETDARTDIFALGAVLYEMATGRKAFEGKSRASVLGKILQVDPPLASSLRPMTPPGMDRAIKRCLEKDADERWQSAKDLMAELKWIAESASRAPVGAGSEQSSTSIWSAVGSRVGRRSVIVSPSAVLLGAAMASLITWNLKPSPAPAVTRFAITLPGDQRLVASQHPLALSPDGSKLAYSAIQGGIKQIYLRALDSAEARALAGTEGGNNPFFSPDGNWLGFVAEGELKKISVNGETPLTLASIGSTPNGASWGSQGVIVFRRIGGPLQQIPESGGTPEPVSRLGKEEIAHIAPEFLPGGQGSAFCKRTRHQHFSAAARTRRAPPSGSRASVEPTLRVLRAPALCAGWKSHGGTLRCPKNGAYRGGASGGRRDPAEKLTPCWRRL